MARDLRRPLEPQLFKWLPGRSSCKLLSVASTTIDEALAKSVMVEGRVIKSEVVRQPLDQITPRTRAGLIELSREVDLIALRWGH
jgi:hypothetical protein